MHMNDISDYVQNERWADAGRELSAILSQQCYARVMIGILSLCRSSMPKWEHWKRIDEIANDEQRWPEFSDVFNDVRRTSLDRTNVGEELKIIDRMAECVCKVASNASWSPGLYDQNAGWVVPELAIAFAKAMDCEELGSKVRSILNSHSQNQNMHNKALKKGRADARPLA